MAKEADKLSQKVTVMGNLGGFYETKRYNQAKGNKL